MKKKTKIILWTVSTLVLLAAIGYGVLVLLAIAATGGWGYGIPSGSTGKVDNRVIRTNAPPQVIYRVDKDRFLTLENYISCDKGGTVYFNNTAQGIKTKLAGSDDMNSRLETNDILGYKGTVINNATNGDLVFPDAPTGFCSNNGCDIGSFKSIDNGRSFRYVSFSQSFDASNLSRKYELIVLDEYFFVRKSPGVIFKYSTGREAYLDTVPRIPVQPLIDPAGDMYYHCDSNIKPDKVEYIEPAIKSTQSLE
ncbi:hypothetical protein [Kluyvera ascorbata]|uniref:T6SS immunity protein Tli3 family protein n=1 Tax=Kluyvera ascorbata TaxID=51288 RepID=UPI0039F72DD6